VSVTMMKMQLFFREAAQEPVRNVGVTEDLDLNDYFPQEPSQLDAAHRLRKAVGDMHDLCEVDAKPAFKEAASTVDLSPLCGFGWPLYIGEDLDAAVANRTRIVRRKLESVKSWLDPFKGQAYLTPQKLHQFLVAGEPKGLREIMGVYKRTKFWKYLKGWKADGKFLKLIAKLKKTVTDLDESVTRMTSNLKALQEELARLIEKRGQAVAGLEEASRASDAAVSTKEEMGRKVHELQEVAEMMRRDIDALAAEVEQAKRKWNAAKQTLLAAHERATSFLEALPHERLELEEQFVAEGVAAQDRAEGLECQLAQARVWQHEAAETLKAARHRSSATVPRPPRA